MGADMRRSFREIQTDWAAGWKKSRPMERVGTVCMVGGWLTYALVTLFVLPFLPHAHALFTVRILLLIIALTGSLIRLVCLWW